MNENLSTPNKYSTMALLVGIIGLAIAGFGVFTGLMNDDPRPIMSWLLGAAFWLSMGIGMLFIVMLWYVFGAKWPCIIRRQLEHALSAFPWLALIILPLILIGWFNTSNPGILWKWISMDTILPGGETVGQDVLYQSKAAYLNLPFFTLRVIFYFVFWIAITKYLRKCSFTLDKDADAAWYHKAHNVSAFGIPVCALVTSFAAFDLFMSLSYHWFSTMYGVCFWATSMRAGFAGAAIICFILSRKNNRLSGLYNEGHRYDLGSLCFAFTVFWAYVSFCQYFLIYNANIPEETFWFSMRELNADWTKNTWWYVSVFGLVLGYFIAPFLYLLCHSNKINPKRFAFVAVWILVFTIIDLYFNIFPTQIPADNAVGYVVSPFNIKIWDISALVGVGGICVWSFINSMNKAEPIPISDPYIYESINHHK